MTLCIHILKLPVKGTPGFRNQILPTLKKTKYNKQEKHIKTINFLSLLDFG